MTIDYDDFMAKKKALAKKMPPWLRNKKRGAKRRPRDPEEREIFFAMVRRRVENAFKSGELKFTGPRKITWDTSKRIP